MSILRSAAAGRGVKSSSWRESVLKKRKAIATSARLHGRDCHCRDPFATAERTEPLVRGRFHAHAELGAADSIGDFFLHRWNVRRDLWRFGDDSRIHVYDPRSAFGE